MEAKRPRIRLPLSPAAKEAGLLTLAIERPHRYRVRAMLPAMNIVERIRTAARPRASITVAASAGRRVRVRAIRADAAAAMMIVVETVPAWTGAIRLTVQCAPVRVCWLMRAFAYFAAPPPDVDPHEIAAWNAFANPKAKGPPVAAPMNGEPLRQQARGAARIARERQQERMF